MMLNEEERSILTVIDTSGRMAARKDLLQLMYSVNDKEFSHMLQRMQEKLEKMTDEEFAAIDLTPPEVTTDE